MCSKDIWFHGDERRERVESLVKDNGLDGSFAVRCSQSKQGAFSLSLLYNKQVYTYLVLPGDDKKLAVQTRKGVQSKRFLTVDDLVEDFKRKDNGLACALKHPVPRPEVRANLLVPSPWPSLSPNKYSSGNSYSDPDDKACKICLDATIDTFIEPCGHVCLCNDCAKKVETCPMCRQQISTIKKAFLP